MAHAINFPGSNFTFKAPDGREDISDLHTFRQPNGPSNVSCWEFTPEELSEVSRTGCAFLSVMSGQEFYPAIVGSETVVRSVVVDYGPVWSRPAAAPATEDGRKPLVEAITAADIEIRNPPVWFYAHSFDAEYWYRFSGSRDEAVAVAEENAPDPVFIQQARREVPSFDIFDAEDICERISEHETWWEDGWEGKPDPAANAELEAELAAVLRRWVIRHGSPIDGAMLDFIGAPEQIDPSQDPAAEAA